MATTIQLLRSDIQQQRPDPGVLANGTPMVNTFETEPGLFFAARDGSLFKIGPASVGDAPPNSSPQGQTGNCLGELWVDTSGADPQLKFFDGTTFVSAFTAPSAVTSVGLTFSDLFAVSGSPITSAGTFVASLSNQSSNTVFAGPETSPGGTPSFRALAASDIPGIPASKITSGSFDSGRIPSLDTSKITSGTFTDARIPSLNASKITSGVLPYTIGGTGVTVTPQNGELLIGNSVGWSVGTLTAGSNLSVVNGAGTISIAVESSPTFSSVLIADPGGDTVTLSAPSVTAPFTIKLPSSDGTNGALLSTDGAGQLTFITSLYGLGSIGGAASLTINAGGANGDVILAPTGSGTVNVSSSRISNLGTPTASADAATKAYVDGLASGIQPKAQVVAASTADIDLTAGGLLTIDTVTVGAGDRVLVKDQAIPAQNGIYEAAVGAWSRASDANTYAELVNAITFVAGGFANLGKTFLCNSAAGGVLGVTAINWIVFSSGQGTVTSVGLSMPADFSISGSPITSSGSFTVSYANQTANTVFAGPTGGGAAAPSFRSLVSGDIPSSLNSHTFTGITLTSTDASAAVGPSLNILRDSASPAANDAIGALTFQGKDSAASTLDYAQVRGEIVDPTDGGEDGCIVFSTVNNGTFAERLRLFSSGNLVPSDDNQYDLGTTLKRWKNIYTGDLHLSNEGSNNDVDGTWGAFTIQEGEEDLFLINRRTGKRYKFILQEV